MLGSESERQTLSPLDSNPPNLGVEDRRCPVGTHHTYQGLIPSMRMVRILAVQFNPLGEGKEATILVSPNGPATQVRAFDTMQVDRQSTLFTSPRRRYGLSHPDALEAAENTAQF